MSTVTRPTKTDKPPEAAVLPLENGDRLSRVEFERRYMATLEVKKAQLIEGIVDRRGGDARRRYGEGSWNAPPGDGRRRASVVRRAAGEVDPRESGSTSSPSGDPLQAPEIET